MSPIRLWAYVVSLTVSAVLLGLLALPAWPVTDLWPIVVLAALTVALANLEIELPFAVSLSFIFASVFAGIIYAGPLAGGLLGLAGSVSFQEIRERKAVVLILGNMSQLFLAGLCAGWIFVALGGVPMQVAVPAHLSATVSFVAAVSSVLTFFLLNFLFVGIAVILRSGVAIAEAVRILSPGSYWISLSVLSLLGWVMAQLIDASSWAGLLLLVLPFIAARRTFRVYAELTEAYTSTVRSLVRAIEAKDPYTRGHSERVAMFARRLAESLGLPPGQVALTERAALLHDVGKIGVALSTLTSPNPLTHDEFNLIRQHPGLGERLLQDVEFLAETAPIVRHHHERIDGGGYPDGLAGEDIPFLARILAAADSYDAMTTDRAYRQKMSHTEAIAEMERVKGQQLDAQAVDAFAALPVPEVGA